MTDPSPLLGGSVDPSGAIEEARSTLTRRQLLCTATVGAVVVVGGRAALASAAEQQSSDFAILNYALILEYLQATFYTEAQRRGALTGGLAEQAKVVGAHERAHVAALLGVLGSAAVARPSFDFRGATENAKSFRETAVAFEDLAVAAYQDQAPLISSRAYLAAVVGIQSVEARHAAWIRRLAGFVPAPTAFDEPISKAHTMHLVASTHFIVSGADTTAHRVPPFTG
jgi:Ferritin-like domain